MSGSSQLGATQFHLLVGPRFVTDQVLPTPSYYTACLHPYGPVTCGPGRRLPSVPGPEYHQELYPSLSQTLTHLEAALPPISMATKSLLLASRLGKCGTSEGTYRVLTLSTSSLPFTEVTGNW